MRKDSNCDLLMIILLWKLIVKEKVFNRFLSKSSLQIRSTSVIFLHLNDDSRLLILNVNFT